MSFSETDLSNIKKISSIINARVSSEKSAGELGKQAYLGAINGEEFGKGQFDDWLVNRFSERLIWLSKEDYLRALTQALWLAPVFAGTDYGSSRQRDMAQVWTDTARGFLGEIALGTFLKEKYAVEIKSDQRRGNVSDFLPSDITKIKVQGKDWAPSKLNLSIKSTKLNGRWLDAPGAQLEHSDAFLLVKIGVLRHHFLAFLKSVSFLKDKLFPSATSLGVLDSKQADELWNEVPSFDPIPAYVAGFIVKKELTLPIDRIDVSLKGRLDTRKRLVVSHGVGLFSMSTLRAHDAVRSLDPEERYRIEIEPIIDSLTGQHFLAHSGGLKYGASDWRKLVDALCGIDGK